MSALANIYFELYNMLLLCNVIPKAIPKPYTTSIYRNYASIVCTVTESILKFHCMYRYIKRVNLHSPVYIVWAAPLTSLTSTRQPARTYIASASLTHRLHRTSISRLYTKCKHMYFIYRQRWATWWTAPTALHNNPVSIEFRKLPSVRLWNIWQTERCWWVTV